jgi:hypothetical protein
MKAGGKREAKRSASPLGEKTIWSSAESAQYPSYVGLSGLI